MTRSLEKKSIRRRKGEDKKPKKSERTRSERISQSSSNIEQGKLRNFF